MKKTVHHHRFSSLYKTEPTHIKLGTLPGNAAALNLNPLFSA